MNALTLSPCPFCDGEATMENYVLEAAVFCEGCRAKITRSHAAHEDTGVPAVIAAWNRRAVSTDLPPLPHPCIYVTHDTETVYCGDVPRDSVPPHDDFYSADKVREYAAASRAGAAVPPDLLDALKAAATSLETLSFLSGRETYGKPPIKSYMGTFPEVREFAASRARVARAAIAAAELVSAALSAATGSPASGNSDQKDAQRKPAAFKANRPVTPMVKDADTVARHAELRAIYTIPLYEATQ